MSSFAGQGRRRPGAASAPSIVWMRDLASRFALAARGFFPLTPLRPRIKNGVMATRTLTVPEPYLVLEDDAVAARIREAKRALGPFARRSGAPLSARRRHRARRHHRRLLQARAPRRGADRREVDRLLRRPLHGGERGHPQAAASVGRSPRHERGLLDGRHGADRRRGGSRGGAGAAGPTLGHADHLHELHGRAQSLLRRARRRGVHLVQLPRPLRVGVRAAGAGVLLPRRAPWPEHGGRRWGSRSTGSSLWDPKKAQGGLSEEALRRAQGHRVEGVLLGPHQVPAPPRGGTPGGEIRA